MAKNKTSRKKPSRKRYEEEHPTVSFRLDKATHSSLKEHLKGTGCSFSGFIKDSLGRERSMVEKRVQILASRRVGPSVEDRLKCLEVLVNEIITTIGSMAPDGFGHFGVRCPRCSGDDLSPYAGKEIATGKYALVWNCGECGFLTKSREPIAPESLVLFPDREIFAFRQADYDVEELVRSLTRLKLKPPGPKLDTSETGGTKSAASSPPHCDATNT